MEVRREFMERALQLARGGMGHVSPNPMVGAVIVSDEGNVIGEGWHRRYGEAHAEVNAVRSVSDKTMLRNSTVYVTLEPCSHYGKTPPCAELLIKCGVPRVVVATLDPFEKVSGRGVTMLREAGIEVEVGLMEKEARELNRTFFTAHTLHRPYVLLKWAQSADGYLDRKRPEDAPAARLSNAESAAAMHLLRSRYDAVMVGSGTVISDNPRLDVRLVSGRNPRPVVVDRRGRISATANLFSRGDAIYCGPVRGDIQCDVVECDMQMDLDRILSELYRLGITSLMVEGGAGLLASFMKEGLWDEARVEVSPQTFGAEGTAHVSLPDGVFAGSEMTGGNTILHFMAPKKS